MAGIAYGCRVVVYIRREPELDGAETWHGVEQDAVRISYTKGRSYGATGTTHTSSVSFSVYDADLDDELNPRDFSEETYIAITYDPGTGFEVEAPTGWINDNRYENGLLEHLHSLGIKTFKLTDIRHYSLIPHWELEGR